MKDSTRKERLKKYSAAAGAVLAAAGTVDAQIIYTDIPDVTVTGNQQAYPLDLNNDATPDYNFITVASATGSGTTQGIPFTYVADIALVQANSSNEWLGYAGSNLVYPAALNFNDPIDGAQNFYTNGVNGGSAGTMAADIIFDLGSLGTAPVQAGPFLGATDAYVGFSFDINGQTHYGWARVDVAADATSIVVKDYAYESTPNTMIPAGATQTTAINTNDLANVRINQMPNNNIMVNVQDEVTGGTLLVTSATGQVIKTANLVEGTNQMSLEGLASGVYIVSAKFNEGLVTEKVFIR